MESGVTCLPNLTKEGGYWLPADPEESHIRFPDNLFIVGTVNVDETTYTFSPKVLDRANTIEFRVGSDEMSLEAKKPVDCAPGPENLIRGFLAIARDNAFHQEHPNSGQEQLRESLGDLHAVLSEGGFEFGHRVFYESIRFAAMYEAAGGERWEDALDLQVLQKLLPRLHGSRRRLEPTLNALADFCVSLAKSAQDARSPESADILSLNGSTALLSRSLQKLKRMTRNLRANQFASFTE
jgi:5-methylcytosine-specific restriction protein B